MGGGGGGFTSPENKAHILNWFRYIPYSIWTFCVFLSGSLKKISQGTYQVNFFKHTVPFSKYFISHFYLVTYTDGQEKEMILG